MPLALVRIDDRLIHGQVVVGWLNAIGFRHIILCSNDIAGNEWEREMLACSVPDGLSVDILAEEETARRLTEGQEKELGEAILLVERPEVIARLLDRGVGFDCVNVGGMHFSEGKRRVANYIYVDDDDIDAFRQICARQVRLEGRDVPTARRLDVGSLLNLRDV